MATFGERSELLSEQIFRATFNGRLIINDEAMNSVEKHHTDNAVIVGLPGQGKSTLGTAIYVIMRCLTGLFRHFFEASDRNTSHTSGAMALKERVKVEGNRRDKPDVIDVIDVEGVDMMPRTHYLLVLSMLLGKAVILCNLEDRDHTTLQLLETIAAAFNLFEDMGICCPLPTIFVPFKHGSTTIIVRLEDDETGDISFKTMAVEEYPAHLKKVYPRMAAVNIRMYSLPRVPDPLHNEEYLQPVRKLVSDLAAIPSGIPVVERVRYTRRVAVAMNSKQPDMIHQLNREFLEKSTRVTHSQMKADAITRIRLVHTAKEVASASTTYEKFKSFEQVDFSADFLAAVRRSPYFHEDHLSCVRGADFECVVAVADSVQDLWKLAVNRYLVKANERGQAQVGVGNREFTAFVTQQLLTAKQAIPFNGNLELPALVKNQIEAKLAAVRASVQEIDGFAVPPISQFPATNYATNWSAIQAELRAAWLVEIDRRNRQGNTAVNTATTTFQAFVTLELNKYKNLLRPDASTALPEEATRRIESKKAEIKSDFARDNPNFKTPNGFLEENIKVKWEAIVSAVKVQWQTAITEERNQWNAVLATHNKTYSTFCERQLTEGAGSIAFLSSDCSIPSANLNAITAKRKELIDLATTQRTANVTIPNDFLNFNYTAVWESTVNTLKTKWESRVQDAKWKRRITTGGDHTCPRASCRQSHISGVTHMQCPQSYFYWVDGPTKYAICDKCEVRRQLLGGVCCYKCHETMSAVYFTDVPN